MVNMYFTPPNEDEKNKIFQELGLTADRVKEAEKELFQWLSEQPHLPQHIDDNVLTAFALYCRKGIEECKTRLDAYFSVRTIFPVLFEDRDPLGDAIMENSKAVAHGMCGGFAPGQCRIYIAKLLSSELDVFNFNAFLRRILLFQDLTMMRDLNAGVYLVADFTGVTVHHFLKLSVSQARDLMFCIQNVYPLRVKKMVFIHVKPFCKTLLETMVMPLLKRKLAARTHFFSDTEKVGRVLPLDILPSDMGGTGPSSEEVNEFWNNEIAAYRDWILNEGTLKSDESKREGANPLKAPRCTIA